MFVSQFNGRDPLSIARERLGLSEDYIEERTASLAASGLVRDGRLSDLGRSSLRVVLTGGVFDIIHPGHIHTLNAARKLGDLLVVVVATAKTARRMKKRTPLHTQEQRRDLVGSLRMVDLGLIGDEEDIFRTVGRVKPEIIALGYDQAHQEKFIKDGCEKNGLSVRVARLQSPVPEISSSRIEKEYGDAIHDI